MEESKVTRFLRVLFWITASIMTITQVLVSVKF
jgi:hypothetical protein